MCICIPLSSQKTVYQNVILLNSSFNALSHIPLNTACEALLAHQYISSAKLMTELGCCRASIAHCFRHQCTIFQSLRKLFMHHVHHRYDEVLCKICIFPTHLILKQDNRHWLHRVNISSTTTNSIVVQMEAIAPCTTTKLRAPVCFTSENTCT